MRAGALRLPGRMWRARVRSGRLAFCAMMAGVFGAAVAAQSLPEGPVEWAQFADPTSRYPHGVLGDDIEHGALQIKYASQPTPITLHLPENRVFEDVAPRLVDLDADGQAEVIVVESHQQQGARLAIYDGAGLIAATPYIGQRFRWLAPIGAADLNGDGAIEIAYIDRPHLAKTLRIWRYRDGSLTEAASLRGLTNHKIGEPDIAGGIRTCNGRSDMIVADADWRRIVAVSFHDNRLATRDLATHRGRDSFAAAMAC